MSGSAVPQKGDVRQATLFPAAGGILARGDVELPVKDAPDGPMGAHGGLQHRRCRQPDQRDGAGFEGDGAIDLAGRPDLSEHRRRREIMILSQYRGGNDHDRAGFDPIVTALGDMGHRTVVPGVIRARICGVAQGDKERRMRMMDAGFDR